MAKVTALIDGFFSRVEYLGLGRCLSGALCALGAILGLICFFAASKATSDIRDYTPGGLIPLFEAIAIMAVCAVGCFLCWFA